MKEPHSPDLDFYLLIPYYTNLPGLVRSLQSISYDPARYGLLIVDDGSQVPLLVSDLSPHIPSLLALEVLRLPENGGITRALNAGLGWLAGRNDFRYVARLDCGDLCAADRFRRQVEFLDLHPDIDLVGSWCVFKDFSSGKAYSYTTPKEHGKIARSMYFRNVFIHPTVMWRDTVKKKISNYPYPENFPHAEDYGFFYEIISKTNAAILPENLVTCEINSKGISLKNRKQQLKSREWVIRQYGKNGFLRLLGIVKLRILGVIPYGMLFQVKKILYGIKLLYVI